MTRQVHIDPVRATAVYQAWGAIVEMDETGQRPGPIGMTGTDMLDGASLALLKSEFLAAKAGVVPLVPLPGGGQGVLTVGGALAQPDTDWPQPELAHLYRLQHKACSALHSSVNKRRTNTPMLPVDKFATSPVTNAEANFWAQVGAGAASMGALPAVAWVVIAAVGILATMAATWYAVRTKVEEIQVEAKLAKDIHQIGSLTDLAHRQLTTTGKVDDNLIQAIKDTGSDVGWGVWPLVIAGVGGAAATGVGVWAWTRRSKRR